jgi:hypothetical protein
LSPTSLEVHEGGLFSFLRAATLCKCPEDWGRIYNPSGENKKRWLTPIPTLELRGGLPPLVDQILIFRSETRAATFLASYSCIVAALINLNILIKII